MGAERAEGPGQGVAAVLVHVGLQRGEARALRQVLAAGDAVRERGIAALQKGDHARDAGAVARKFVEEDLHSVAAALGRQGFGTGAHFVQTFGREQTQHQGQGEVLLHRLHPARAQEAREVGSGGIGRVELGHRGDDRQDTWALR